VLARAIDAATLPARGISPSYLRPPSSGAGRRDLSLLPPPSFVGRRDQPRRKREDSESLSPPYLSVPCGPGRYLSPISAPPLGEQPLASLRSFALTMGGCAHILWWFTTSTFECFDEEDISTKSSTSQASARLQASDADPSRS
jgi:hypothetical protein